MKLSNPPKLRPGRGIPRAPKIPMRILTRTEEPALVSIDSKRVGGVQLERGSVYWDHRQSVTISDALVAGAHPRVTLNATSMECGWGQTFADQVVLSHPLTLDQCAPRILSTAGIVRTRMDRSANSDHSRM